jgi:hypothetical protein
MIAARAKVILKRRSRPVTFRVCTDEYEALTNACLQSRARSISEFAREAVLRRMQSLQHPESSLTGDLLNLSRELRELDLSLEATRRKIRDVIGSAGGDS